MDPDTHFVFGTHHQHGYAAAFAPDFPSHLAHWLLTRLQFEPVPQEPGLYRLTDPQRDGARRTRQAAQDLRAQSYAVHVDADVAHAESGPSRPARKNGIAERRARIAHAAATRPPRRGVTPTVSAPAARTVPPEPSYLPTVRLTGSAPGRGR
ncbi:hypothetical protein AB0J13_07425 [Streptomyces anulatus]|uniref:hypothetical protein n=1 Tax=Streptomyces anulatus TaxID=1892 RepID=UPI0033EE2195